MARPVSIFDGEVCRNFELVSQHGRRHVLSIVHDTVSGARAALLDYEELPGSIGTTSFFNAGPSRIPFWLSESGESGFLEVSRHGLFGFRYRCELQGREILETTAKVANPELEFEVTVPRFTYAHVCDDDKASAAGAAAVPAVQPGGEGVAWYELSVRRRRDNSVTNVHRRFRDFATLHEQVREWGGVLDVPCLSQESRKKSDPILGDLVRGDSWTAVWSGETTSVRRHAKARRCPKLCFKAKKTGGLVQGKIEKRCTIITLHPAHREMDLSAGKSNRVGRKINQVDGLMKGHHLRASLPRLPNKHLKLVIDHGDRRFADERREQLQDFLRILLPLPHVGDLDTTRAFLGILGNTREYSVVFKRQKLGLVLQPSPRLAGPPVVASLQEENGRNAAPSEVSVGDRVSKIGGAPVEGMPFAAVINLMASLPRPLLVHFLTEIVPPRPPPSSPPVYRGAQQDYDATPPAALFVAPLSGSSGGCGGGGGGGWADAGAATRRQAPAAVVPRTIEEREPGYPPAQEGAWYGPPANGGSGKTHAAVAGGRSSGANGGGYDDGDAWADRGPPRDVYRGDRHGGADGGAEGGAVAGGSFHGSNSGGVSSGSFYRGDGSRAQATARPAASAAPEFSGQRSPGTQNAWGWSSNASAAAGCGPAAGFSATRGSRFSATPASSAPPSYGNGGAEVKEKDPFLGGSSGGAMMGLGAIGSHHHH
ncbi:unnamed protein product, partial [Phaeothamnion confervicola]